MADNKMLIDAGHREETRVAMVRGNRVDEFDFESEHKHQLRGNIYLAKVTRVEPSLQAAFVDYGGNRHGFLAFSEIHPDYYQIPIADRQALLAAEQEEVRNDADDDHLDADDDADIDDADIDDASSDDGEDAQESAPKKRRRHSSRSTKQAKAQQEDQDETSDDEEADDSDEEISAENENDDVVSEEVEKPKRRTRRAPARSSKQEDGAETGDDGSEDDADKAVAKKDAADEKPAKKSAKEKSATSTKKAKKKADDADDGSKGEEPEDATSSPEKPKRKSRRKKASADDEADASETTSEDAQAESSTQEESDGDSDSDDKDSKQSAAKPKRRSSRRRIRARDDSAADDSDDDNGKPVEEIGSDDAMEEVPKRRASRRHYKIQEVIKRRQILLVQVVKEERGNKGAALTTYLSLAGRYSVLMPNTARGGGISRKITNAGDRKRLKAIAADLDVPNGMGVILRTAGAARKSEEIQRDFEYLMRLWESVRTLTLESTAPCLVYEEGSLIKRSIRDLYDTDTKEILVAGESGYREAKDFMSMLMPEHAKKVKLYKDRVPLFAKMGVETQLDAMLQPQVTLKSGGYIIIDQTEALVSIDVNSGKSTRQHSVEETATQTNLEAADEIARQLRLRDLAGLIVIDFIDMDERRNNRAVEKRLKDALKHDRARIQVGRISHFGLMEMSRQRIRASVLESTTQVCPTCDGLGHVRSPSSVALAVLRAIEDHLHRSSRNDLIVRVSTRTALYLLNNKRDSLTDLEHRFGVHLTIEADNAIGNVPCVIEKGGPASRTSVEETAVQPDTVDPSEAQQDETSTTSDDSASTDSDVDNDGTRRKRRRRRRRGRGASADDDQNAAQADADEDSEVSSSDNEPESDDGADDAEDDRPPRRRRRRRSSAKNEASAEEENSEETGDGEAEDSATAKDGRRRKKAPITETKAEPEIEQATDSPSQESAADGLEQAGEDEKASAKSQTRRNDTVRKKAPVAAKPALDKTEATAEAEKTQSEPPKPAEPRPERRPTRSTVRRKAPVAGSNGSQTATSSTSAEVDNSEQATADDAPESDMPEESAVEDGTVNPGDEKKKEGWWRRRFF
ncbi:MAG: Rne/Rng family ribonuclease [Ahrensia sp.]|nr:Rne/Rng family ribonuclease [Ahrensia sp.]